METRMLQYYSPGIYLIKNIENNKVYIGASKNMVFRIIQHRSDLKCNRHRRKNLQEDYNKHGFMAFEYLILEDCDEWLLDEREKYWIEHYDAVNKGYNLANGGHNGFGKDNYMFGKTHTDEFKKKMSERLQGHTINLGKKWTEEHKQKIADNNPRYWKDKNFSDEHKQKLSEKKKGTPSNATKCTAEMITDVNNGMPMRKFIDKHQVSYRIFYGIRNKEFEYKGLVT